MLKQVTYWNVALSLPVFAGLLLFAHPLLSLFGATYAKGAAALAILAAGQLFNAATGPLGQMINMSGRPYLTLLNNALEMSKIEAGRMNVQSAMLREIRRLFSKQGETRATTDLIAGALNAGNEFDIS